MSKKNRAPRLTRNERRAQAAARPAMPTAPSLRLPEHLRNQPMHASESLGLRKLSDILGEIVAPVLADFPPDPSHAAIENLYAMAVAVWNATAPGAAKDALDEVVALISGGQDPATPRAVVDAIAEMRRALYPDDARVIADLQIQWVGGRAHIHVASLVPQS